MKKKVLLGLLIGMMLGTSVCSARIANWRIAYDGYQTPDGVRTGMPASVLTNVYGTADWAGPSPHGYDSGKGITIYHYMPMNTPSQSGQPIYFLEFRVNSNGCIQDIGVLKTFS